MQAVSIDLTEIHFLDIGKGPAILFVHGFPLDHSMWYHQIEALSSNYRVIVPDLPGFGLSPLVSGSQQIESTPLSLAGMAKTMIWLLDHLKIDKVSFCGLSMGGYVGWQFWKLFPDRLESLIACNTRAAGDNETVMRARRLSAQNARAEGIPRLADDMIPRLFSKTSLENRKDEVDRIRKIISHTNPETVAQASLAMADRPDATPWLSEINVPTLFIAGSEDVITPSAEMRGNAEMVSGGKFAEIEGAGHMSPMERPLEFNQILAEFLSSKGQ